MMHLQGVQPIKGDALFWQLSYTDPLTRQSEMVDEGRSDAQLFDLFFNLEATDKPVEALRSVLQYNEITWLSPAEAADHWTLDLDEMKRVFPGYFPMPWFVGKIDRRPQYETVSLADRPRTGVRFHFTVSDVEQQK